MIVNFKMEVKTWLNSLLQMVTLMKKARRSRATPYKVAYMSLQLSCNYNFQVTTIMNEHTD